MIEMEAVQGICPLRCIQCELTYSLYKEPLSLKFKDFKYVMDQFPDLGWAGNNGLGDPFTNPDYHQMVKYIDDQEIPQEIYLTSQLLSKEDMKRFVYYKSFLFTKFSFDGATKETYEKVRPGVSFDKVVENIKFLNSYKKQKGKHWPKIEFHFLLLKQNLHEAESFIDFVDSLDIECSGIMFSKLLHYYPEIEGIYTDVPEGLGQKLIERGKMFGIPVYFNGDTVKEKPPANTCTQWMMPYIFPDGTVIPCCNPNEANMRNKQREWSMGNVFETPFRDIWFGPKYSQLRKSLREGNPNNYMPVCKNLCAVHDVTKVC
jgi:MoaA/NifB/PqqE/SkfB family radical SAM enzyme